MGAVIYFNTNQAKFLSEDSNCVQKTLIREAEKGQFQDGYPDSQNKSRKCLHDFPKRTSDSVYEQGQHTS